MMKMKPTVEHEIRKLVASGKEKGYCIMTVPKSWQDDNRSKAGESIHTYFSQLSKGYLLVVLDKLYKRKFAIQTLRMSLGSSREIVARVSKSIRIGDKYLEDVLEDLVRFNLMGAMTYGYPSAMIKFEPDENASIWSLYKKFHIMMDRLNNIESLQGKSIFEIKLDDAKREMTSMIPRPGEVDPLEYAYSQLSRIMLQHHENLFEKAIACLDNNLDQKIYEEMVTSEGALDFLWFYYLRQLKKGIDVGLFSGSELTGTHAVCLSVFSKMLEQNADSLMRIVSLLDYLKKRAEKDKARSFLGQELKQFSDKIRSDLDVIRRECETLVKLLPDAIDASKSDLTPETIDGIYESITETISKYHGVLVGRTGEISESYVTERKVKSLQELGRVLFGEYEEFATNIEQRYAGKGYSFIVSQIVAELRRIAKFPRNIAVICILILVPITRKKEPQQSQE